MEKLIGFILGIASSDIFGVSFVFVLIFSALITGLSRKAFRQTWNTIVFIILFLISCFVLTKPFGSWIANKFMARFALTSDVVVDGVNVYRINSFTNFISFLCRLTDDARFTEAYSINLANSIACEIALALLTMLDLFIAPVVSVITWPFIRLIIPKKWDLINRRFIGLIVSFIETVFAISVVINCYSSYSDGLTYIINNQQILDKIGMSTNFLNVLRFFQVDFFGFFKVLNMHLFTFKFAADGKVYETSSEFMWLAKTTFPSGADVDILANGYKVRLFTLWAVENGVTIIPNGLLSLGLRRIG